MKRILLAVCAVAATVAVWVFAATVAPAQLTDVQMVSRF